VAALSNGPTIRFSCSPLRRPLEARRGSATCAGPPSEVRKAPGTAPHRIPPELEWFREHYLGALSARERQAILLDFADAIEVDELTGRSSTPLRFGCDLLDEQGAVDLYWRARHVRGLRRDGVPIALIPKRLGISKSAVQRDLHKLETIWREDLSLIDASNAETGWAWTRPED
jgi:hypothetical protein